MRSSISRNIDLWSDAIRPLLHDICVSRRDFTSAKSQHLLPVLFRCFISMKGILYTYHHEMSRFSQKVLHTTRVLPHRNASLYYCMFFNQMVHSLVQEAFSILAPTLSLKNSTIRNGTQIIPFGKSAVLLP